MKWSKFAIMKNLNRFILLIACTLCAGAVASAQKTCLPAVGAQVFIEPGQTPEQIDSWFSCLEKHRMQYARIRLFGSHIQKADGSWDFSLYDLAFDAAQRHGIKLFVTLFPATDELNDVGGFKFPRDEKHLSEIGEYIDNVVAHFKDKEPMFAWVLQNEPGTGSAAVPATPLAGQLKQEWLERRKREERTGFLEADWTEQEFLVYYTTWYLNWISERVRQQDTVHYRHINPHQILELLPEYDFAALEKILTSLGASMHLSWHFSYFDREEFPVGISLMADIIRGNALGNPFWITELQGGNVTASGYRVLCPSKDEIPQWLWTGIGSGAEGIIFWTLNQRAAVNEAGEWGLLDFQNGASDRLVAASEVAKAVQENAGIMSDAVPVQSGIHILYNNESLRINKFNAGIVKDSENEGRGIGAVMKSVAAAYKAVASWGIVPEVGDMKFFDWTDAHGRTVILPDIISIPSIYYESIRSFVDAGGRVIATGLTGYYDENMKCSFMGHFPLADVFGAELREVKAGEQYFSLPPCDGITLDAHLWRSVLSPLPGAEILSQKDGEVYAVSNRYGKGEVLWFPAMIDLGCRHRNERALADFYGKEAVKYDAAAPFCFPSPSDGVLVRTMQSKDRLIVITVNKTGRTVRVRPVTGYKYSSTIYDNKNRISCNSNGTMRLIPQECAVTVWTK